MSFKFILWMILSIFLLYSCKEEPLNPQNSGPIINGLIANPDSIRTQGYSEVICNATDPDNDYLQYIWHSDIGSFSGSGDTVKWYPSNETGLFTIECDVFDSNGGMDTDSILIQVGTSIPTIDSIVSEKTILSVNESVKLFCFASDPDNDQLNYLWESDGGSFKGAGNEVDWIAPGLMGTYSVTCKVIDSHGNFNKDELFIEVLNINEGLAAYFPFNGGIKDESGNGNIGGNFGAILTEDIFNNPNSAYDFNGSEYIRIGHDTSLNPAGKDYSISIWFQHNGPLTTENDYDALIAKGNYNSGSLELLEWMVRGGEYNGAFFRYRTLNAPVEDLTFDNDLSSIVSDGSWHNIVVVIDEGASIEGKMYLDGILQGTREKFSLNIDPYEPLLIGDYGWGTASFFNGKLDQLRIYNKALSEKEIYYLYNSKL